MERVVSEERPAVTSQDRFSLSYFLWVAPVFLLFTAGPDLDRIFNLWLLLVPVLFLPALAVTIYWIVALIRNVVLGRWRRVVSVLAAPFAAYILFAGAGAIGLNPQWIRFEIGKHYYISQIENLGSANGPRFKMFDWGQTGGAAVTNFIYTLIYDETDEISLPSEKRSKDWLDRANKLCPGTIMCSILSPSYGMSVTARKIEGHFYIVTLAW